MKWWQSHRRNNASNATCKHMMILLSKWQTLCSRWLYLFPFEIVWADDSDLEIGSAHWRAVFGTEKRRQLTDNVCVVPTLKTMRPTDFSYISVESISIQTVWRVKWLPNCHSSLTFDPGFWTFNANKSHLIFLLTRRCVAQLLKYLANHTHMGSNSAFLPHLITSINIALWCDNSGL